MLGIGIAVLCLAVTVDRVFGVRAPDIATRWGSGAAVTNAVRANRLAQPGASPAALAKAERLAGRALSREPTSVPAVRALGQVTALRGDMPRADRLFRYSQQLSRRDFLTQMWLIEERVRHNDIDGTLIHYDRALRTVGRARAVLFPVLVSAISTPSVLRGAERLLAQRPAWGPDFLAVMAQMPDASPDALGRLTIAARLRSNVAAEREALDATLQRLVTSGRYALAYAAWRRAVGARNSGSLIRDIGFEDARLLAPFDWSFANETDLSATREPGGTGTVLVLRASNGASGEFARQLLMLRPGTYRLSLTSSGAGVDPVARAIVAVTCAAGTSELLRLPLSADAQTRLSGKFAVPGECPAQALTIAAPAGLGMGSGNADAGVLVDDLTLMPVRP